ncbi:MAG: DUF5085 family protein [Clostridiales bacterium]|nr:DUF5085 family protein [Clostridiales bacterium]
MINNQDSIRYRNVLSRKYRFHYSDMNKAIEDFMEKLSELKATGKGPFFYSLNNVPMDEIMNVEFFMPVREDYVDTKDIMEFHSYFSIENMISHSIYDKVEQNTELVYRLLLDYIEENELQQVTPIFHVMSGDRSFPYIFIKIGVSEK